MGGILSTSNRYRLCPSQVVHMQQNLHHNQHVDPKDIPSLSPQGTHKFYVFLSVPSPTDYGRFGNMFSPPASLAVATINKVLLFPIVCMELSCLYLCRRSPGRLGTSPCKNGYCNAAKPPAHTPTLVSPTFISADLHAYIALHCVNGFKPGTHGTSRNIDQEPQQVVTRGTVDAHRVYSFRHGEVALLLIRDVEMVPIGLLD